nr:MAG TPA: hypothetical protein [Caudoviricetes sp.]
MLTRRKDKSLLLPHSEKHTADCPTRTAARFTRWRKEKNLLEKKPHTRTNAYPHGRTKLSTKFCNCLIFRELHLIT